MSPIVAVHVQGCTGLNRPGRIRRAAACLVVGLAIGMTACREPETSQPDAPPDAPPAAGLPVDSPAAPDTHAPADTVMPTPEPGTPEFSNVPWDAARDRGAAWRGLGQEPGWTVEIHADSIVYVGDYGEHNVTLPAPEPVRDGRRITWHATSAAADLRVVFEELPCTDIMSGQEFDWTVTLTIDGRELNGCGRRL